MFYLFHFKQSEHNWCFSPQFRHWHLSNDIRSKGTHWAIHANNWNRNADEYGSYWTKWNVGTVLRNVCVWARDASEVAFGTHYRWLEYKNDAEEDVVCHCDWMLLCCDMNDFNFEPIEAFWIWRSTDRNLSFSSKLIAGYRLNTNECHQFCNWSVYLLVELSYDPRLFTKVNDYTIYGFRNLTTYTWIVAPLIQNMEIFFPDLFVAFQTPIHSRVVSISICL